ncbi:MAG: bifunctional nicotinamidase/pyrazinamidase [Treponema sp.]|jgi:nicotinamidase/pyrazinamidase|nr:bifunctional nicotinamidase/pyrazinamidase [Treponema sp.]
MDRVLRETALLEIDVQNDFCPGYASETGRTYTGGALAVNRGDTVIEPLNALAARVSRGGGRVIATADWHPRGHISFASSHPGRKTGEALETGQILWPDHCVQGTWGAAFHERLDLGPVNLILRKGVRPDLDSYSAFFENDRISPTGLEGYLRGLGIKTVIAGGLATDYCVFYTALDARRLGFTVIVPEDAVRGVGQPEGSVEGALRLMAEAGVIFKKTGAIL